MRPAPRSVPHFVRERVISASTPGSAASSSTAAIWASAIHENNSAEQSCEPMNAFVVEETGTGERGEALQPSRDRLRRSRTHRRALPGSPSRATTSATVRARCRRDGRRRRAGSPADQARRAGAVPQSVRRDPRPRFTSISSRDDHQRAIDMMSELMTRTAEQQLREPPRPGDPSRQAPPLTTGNLDQHRGRSSLSNDPRGSQRSHREHLAPVRSTRSRISSTSSPSSEATDAYGPIEGPNPRTSTTCTTTTSASNAAACAAHRSSARFACSEPSTPTTIFDLMTYLSAWLVRDRRCPTPRARQGRRS